MKNKPKEEDFGFQYATGFDGESGWMLEGGKEAYNTALEKWKLENVCHECLSEVGSNELVMFGGFCENCAQS